jgi:hypothetical protein
LFVPLQGFRFRRGEDLLETFTLAEAERFSHVFCRRCGASMPFRSSERGLAGIPMGALDGDPGMSPQNHIFVGSKAPWVEIRDDLPQFERHKTSS